MSVQLLSVNSVQIALNKSNPPTLVVIVEGRAATPGYRDVRLESLEGALSADGIFDLSLVGEPPDGIVAQVVVNVHASLVIDRDVDRIIGAMVHSRTNAMTALLSEGIDPLAAVGATGGTSFFSDVVRPSFTIAEDFTSLALGEEGPTFPFGGESPPQTFLRGEGSGPFAMEKFPFGEGDPGFANDGVTDPPRFRDLSINPGAFGARVRR